MQVMNERNAMMARAAWVPFAETFVLAERSFVAAEKMSVLPEKSFFRAERALASTENSFAPSEKSSVLRGNRAGLPADQFRERLRNTDLHGTDLQSTHLHGTHLHGTDLHGTHPHSAALQDGSQAARTQRSQRGSSLIEVLVTVVVLSIGMLSMLWAQTKSMGYQRTAEFRNVATQIASEYADRMRANAEGAIGYLHKDRYAPGRAIEPSKIGNKCLTGKADCTADEMAQTDKHQMRVLARNSMPGGDLHVTEGKNGGYDIWVLWQQPDMPGLDDSSLSSASLCPQSLGLSANQRAPQCLLLGVIL